MPRIMSPPKSELNKLRKPLEACEWRVLELFDAYLPEGWEIYVKPHLNGLKPDFILLNPAAGIAVFEVKKCSLADMPEQNTFVENNRRYKREIQELYCPRIACDRGLPVITVGIIFPFIGDNELRQAFQNPAGTLLQYNPITGRNALENRALFNIFPEAFRKGSKFMTSELAKDFRLWLVGADASRTQREPLELDQIQTKLSKTRTKSGPRRITGPAGSGKSIVLAARAAQLISDGKDVLVVAFNITLLNYLADAAERNNPAARKSGTWLNFHHWCKRVCQDSGHYKEYKDVWQNNSIGIDKDIFPDSGLCTLVELIIDADSKKHSMKQQVQRYDAILLDEGQDCKPVWWRLLRKVCKPGGEMLLAADATQDVYGRAEYWTDGEMKGAGFAGNWIRLKVSYRLPSGLIPFVREFGKKFLPEPKSDLPDKPIQLDLNLTPCRLCWVQVELENVVSTAVDEICDMLTLCGKQGLKKSDMTVLVDNQKSGMKIVNILKEHYKIDCIHTFDNGDGQGRDRKLKFLMNDAKVKVTTLHSFKGWETRFLLISMERVMDQNAMSLFYSGITRLKKDLHGSFLTVICGEPKLAKYAESWPNFTDLVPESNYIEYIEEALLY